MRTTKLPSPARLRLVVVMHRETIGQRIAERRKALDLSQEALADRIGVRAQTVSRWERGANLGRINNLDRVAGALEISVGDLMADLNGDVDAAGPLDELASTDLATELQAIRDQLDRIEEMVRESWTAVQDVLDEASLAAARDAHDRDDDREPRPAGERHGEPARAPRRS